jgi:hypothetical protein
MAGLDPATQQSRVSAAKRPFRSATYRGPRCDSPTRTDVRALGGRVKPGHDEIGLVVLYSTLIWDEVLRVQGLETVISLILCRRRAGDAARK